MSLEVPVDTLDDARTITHCRLSDKDAKLLQPVKGQEKLAYGKIPNLADEKLGEIRNESHSVEVWIRSRGLLSRFSICPNCRRGSSPGTSVQGDSSRNYSERAAEDQIDDGNGD
ncbi:unnamed protein product [Calypogeia fissa]